MVISILVLISLISITASSINTEKYGSEGMSIKKSKPDFDYHKNNPVQYRMFKEWFNMDFEHFSNVLLYYEYMYGGNIGRE